ncbi:MAG: hypothetical protein IJB69_07630 [Clostridia bacterium]|nr:hypothetical protein [Clostridia bacterium]
MKKKSLILRLLPWVIVLALLAALVIFVGIPLYTKDETPHMYKPTIYYYEGDSKPLTMENEYLSFEMDPTTTHFKVVDKATGVEWLSNPADAANDKVANSAHKENLQATALITYCTSAGAVEMNNYKYSIENGNYQLQQLEDGSIRVDYAIGKIEKQYLIPQAITKERYDAFADQMKKSTKKKLSSNYALYEPEKLDSKKNKDEIIAMYPSVVEQPLYILKSDVKENVKKKVEEYFAEVGYSQEDYDLDMQLVAGAKESSASVFNVSLVYRLEDGDLVVEVPYDAIRYTEGYAITYVTPLPMFGAAGTEDEGFMFVPEGGGALIQLNNGKLQQSTYYANTYGWDYATRRDELINETRNTFPVFGMAKNGASFLCFMEGATSFGGVQADISMRYNSYNWLCAKYNVLHGDQYNVSAKTAQLVFMFESAIPDETVVHRYRFINSGDYVDMANAYGDYLRENDLLKDQKASEEVPVSVELVGAIDKTVVKFGLPIDSVFATTTFAQAEEIIGQLTDKGIKNLNVRLSGWMNGGLTQEVIQSVNVLNELGGKSALEQLIASSKEKNVNLFLDGISCFAYNSGIFEGFVPFGDAARYTTREQVVITRYDPITYIPQDWLEDYYLVRPDYAKDRTDTLIRFLDETDAAGISFRDIGSFLSGDYNPKDTTNREEVKAMNIQSMLDAKAAGQAVMVKVGNDYALPYADIITDMDLTGTKYSLIDQMVPFYQIAIHGLKDYTGEPINLSGDYYQEFLRCVEYGGGLNFTFMAEDAKVLQDTVHSSLFGSHYGSWAEDATAMISRYQADMQGLNQQRIVDHQQVSDFVAVTTYEDGTKVYVNYANEAYSEGGVEIAARDYTVERGQ